jgi:hypothetical protein
LLAGAALVTALAASCVFNVGGTIVGELSLDGTTETVGLSGEMAGVSLSGELAGGISLEGNVP